MLDGGRLSILGRRALYIIRCRKVELELTEASETFEFVVLTTRVVVVTTTVVMVVPKIQSAVKHGFRCFRSVYKVSRPPFSLFR